MTTKEARSGKFSVIRWVLLFPAALAGAFLSEWMAYYSLSWTAPLWFHWPVLGMPEAWGPAIQMAIVQIFSGSNFAYGFVWIARLIAPRKKDKIHRVLGIGWIGCWGLVLMGALALLVLEPPARGQGVTPQHIGNVCWALSAIGTMLYTFRNRADKDAAGEQKNAEAVKWVRQAVEQGDTEAQHDLGVISALRGDLPQGRVEAVKWFRKAAEQGHPGAQCNLGMIYAEGQGVEQDWPEAVRWYRLAAEQGDAAAQLNLGTCYANGQGVQEDLVEAVKWWRKAADQGRSEAQLNLGLCYAKGRGVEQDLWKAVKWFREAAEQGDVEAQVSLALRYHMGDGVAQDWPEAVRWYRLAAEQGYARAQFGLATCYDRGEGVPQDYGEAVEWFRKAAEQGYANAQWALGLCYAKGQGVAMDLIQAYAWLDRAAAVGNQIAGQARDALSSHMNPKHLAKGQALSRELDQRIKQAQRNDPGR